MSSLTTRVNLVKPADPEAVDVSILNANADIIDSFLGAILVNAGVTPPNSSLFDGAMIVEKVTGITWVAVKNGGGGYDKLYAPLQPQVLSSALGIAGFTTGTTGLGAAITLPTRGYNRNINISLSVTYTAGSAADTVDIICRLNGVTHKAIRTSPGGVSYGFSYCYVHAAGVAASYQAVCTRIAGATAMTIANDPTYSYMNITETPCP